MPSSTRVLRDKIKAKQIAKELAEFELWQAEQPKYEKVFHHGTWYWPDTLERTKKREKEPAYREKKNARNRKWWESKGSAQRAERTITKYTKLLEELREGDSACHTTQTNLDASS